MSPSKQRVDSRLPIPGTNNVRDVGGLAAGDGFRVRRGRLYRAEAIGLPGSGAESVWDEAHSDQYLTLGLRTVVDLRSAGESRLVPTAWGRATGAHVVDAPIPEGVEGSDTDFMKMLRDGTITRFDEEDLGRWYQNAFRRRADVIGDAIRALAKPDGLPALVHCHAGKDRTGLVVALVLEAVGVAREDVVGDYVLTGEFRADRAAAHVAELEAAGIHAADVRVFWESPARAMESALEFLDTNHGGAVGYLTGACGVTSEQIASLRNGLLEQE